MPGSPLSKGRPTLEFPARREGHYSHLYRGAKGPVLLLNARDLRFADCNAAAVAALRCASKREVVGQSPAHFSPQYQPDGRGSTEKAAEILAGVLGSQTARCHWMHRCKDGAELSVDVMLSRIRVGTETLVYVRWLSVPPARSPA